MTIEEETILRDQHLDMIYDQSGILYEIIPSASRSNIAFGKPKPWPHADGIFVSVDSPIVQSLVKQIHNLFVNKYVVGAVNSAIPSHQEKSS